MTIKISCWRWCDRSRDSSLQPSMVPRRNLPLIANCCMSWNEKREDSCSMDFPRALKWVTQWFTAVLIRQHLTADLRQLEQERSFVLRDRFASKVFLMRRCQR